jgi:hypothetical protein
LYVPAFYIVLERKPPRWQGEISGGKLSREIAEIDTLAVRNGVRPLTTFFSAPQSELSAFAASHGLSAESLSIPKETWFSAEDGLKTVRQLLANIDQMNASKAQFLRAELEQFEKVLRIADEACVRWHLAVDF